MIVMEYLKSSMDNAYAVHSYHLAPERDTPQCTELVDLSIGLPQTA
jgi:hypothetical protein